jgi:hypothetical protein
VRADGSCPTCGAPVDPGGAHATRADDSDPELDPLPWHFKLLVGAIAVYLGYRAFQGVEWLVGRL